MQIAKFFSALILLNLVPCTINRVKDKYKLHQTFSVNPVYLRHANSGAAIDFMVSYYLSFYFILPIKFSNRLWNSSYILHYAYLIAGLTT